MNAVIRHTIILLLGTTFGVVIATSSNVFAERNKNPNAPLPLQELHAFTEVLEKIKNDYVEPVEDKELLESAIRGMVSGLDPHSSYLNAEAYHELQLGTTGQFGGLGIEVGMENGFVKVISPIDDTPAQRAGVQSGDLIIRLDETAVKGLSLNDAVKLMRGKPGTKIVLTVIREGQEQPLKFTLVRDVVKVKSVKKELFDEGYAYIRISQFQTQTQDNLVDAIKDMKKDNKGELKGLVLDLRNNPGGVLSAAVSVSDAFLEKGLIVYTKGRLNNSRLEYKAKPKDVLEGAPLVVLVNGGSASASEIVAGALQDHKRAVIMGSKTFGKGSVQTIIPMPNETALKLTTALYYTPSGRSIQAEGINPDIKLDEFKLTKATTKENLDNIKEADLAGHLENNNGKTNKEKVVQDKGKSADKAPLSEKENTKDKANASANDYALHEALNLLRGMHIMHKKM